MRKIIACLVLPIAAGCLSTSTPEVSRWMLDYMTASSPSAAKPVYGVARVSQVTVRSPYGLDELVVMKANGSMAFDAYNTYAAAPAQLLRGCLYDALTASGLFKSVVNASSSAAASVSVELLVTRMVLDCRSGDHASRKARVDLVLRLVDSDGQLIKVLPASGEAEATDANFSLSFSKAISAALEQALADAQ